MIPSRRGAQMPIHLNDLDVVIENEGVHSALIILCFMCPAVIVATREKKPFIQFMSNLLKSPPFEKYIKTLQSALSQRRIETKKLFRAWKLSDL